MANYRTHSFFNLLLILPLAAFAIIYFLQPTRFDLYIFIAAFGYATLFMSPDSDIANKIKLFSLRGLMTLPFRPYSKIFAHRGISHWLIIGTLTRIAWLAFLFIIIYTFIYKKTMSLNPILHFYNVHKTSVLYCFSGLCISDMGHLLLDRKKA
ncbi:MAG: metal-binding protein [Simkaniaceae bacterium]|nr:metal-binding protein [Simkaniaceae bacterium]MCF7851744.1 metal-binding protein [Simkaniaceae bacterium]